MQLRDLQLAVQAHLFERDPGIFSAITGSTQRQIKQRLNIYADAYYLRLFDVLKNQFPILQKHLKKKPFNEMAQHYLIEYPSRHFSVNRLGQFLVQFLTNTEPYSQLPYLAELATFEWQLAETAIAEDAGYLDSTALTQIPIEAWADLHLVLHPSVAMHDFRWNSVELWQAYTKRKHPPQSQRLDQPATYLFWRSDDLQSYFLLIDPMAAQLIQGLQQQKSFGEMCQLFDTQQTDEQVAIQVVQQLNYFLHLKLLSNKVVYIPPLPLTGEGRGEQLL